MKSTQSNSLHSKSSFTSCPIPATKFPEYPVFVAVEPLDKLYLCPECRSREVIRKGKRIRRVQTLPIGFHPVYLEVGVPRCQCNTCQHIFEIAPPFARLTRTTPKR